MSSVAISTPFNISLDFEIADLGRRLGAYFIDLAVLVIYIIAVQYLLGEVMSMDMIYNGGLYIVMVGLPVLTYHLFMEMFNNGQSLGKMALGIRVMSLEGGEPHIGQYIIRWVFRVFEWVPMLLMYTSWVRYNFVLQGFLTGVGGLVLVVVIAVNKRSQRFGDMAAGTAVVNTRIKLGINDTVFRQVDLNEHKVLFPEVMRLTDRDINAIRSVLDQSRRSNRYETAHRVSMKVKEVLKIDSNLDVLDFLERLLADYNYLATKE